MSSILNRSCLLCALVSYALVASGAHAVQVGGTCPDACEFEPDCEDQVVCSIDVCEVDGCSNTATVDCPDCTRDGQPDYCVQSVPTSANWSETTAWPGMSSGFPGDVNGKCGLIADVSNQAIISLDTDVSLRNGRLINEGTILVSGNHALSVPDGPAVLRGGGRYLADPDTGAGTTASLTALGITLEGTDGCGPATEMVISEFMEVTTTGTLLTGNFVLDGPAVLSCPAGGAGAASLGGKTPPILKVREPTAVLSRGQDLVGLLSIGGSFELRGAAEVCVGCDRAGNPAPIPIIVGAHFFNSSRYPSLFDWRHGELRFSGAGPHQFEVAGLDLGTSIEGFNTTAPTAFSVAPHTNFSMDTIVVPDNSQVTFQNAIPNSIDDPTALEALYVRNLVLGNGSTVVIDGCIVYHCNLTNNGANISFLNGGELLAADCAVPAVSTWGIVILAALMLCFGTVIARARSVRRCV